MPRFVVMAAPSLQRYLVVAQAIPADTGKIERCTLAWARDEICAEVIASRMNDVLDEALDEAKWLLHVGTA